MNGSVSYFVRAMTGGARRLGDIPEVPVASLGFPLSLMWEVLQSPFYTDTFEASWAMLVYNRLHCSVGDALILLASFWLVSVIWGRSWMARRGIAPVAAFVALGVGYTIFSEVFNVAIGQSWAYSRWMPTVAGIGLAPILQWFVIPMTLVTLVRTRARFPAVASAAGGK